MYDAGQQTDGLKRDDGCSVAVGLRVAELFAGVGGFRLGLEAAGHEVVWSNQWEPASKAQHASDCYVNRFGLEGHSNVDIHDVPSADIPPHDLLVGGFPCQDYSVAATLDKSRGIEGKKGILWWQIDRILKDKSPSFVLLENVDRLLRSPSGQRGRDFGIVLSCLTQNGYVAEWRVLNAADYGFAHRRRRVFLFAAHERTALGKKIAKAASRSSYLFLDGFFAQAFPVVPPTAFVVEARPPDQRVGADLAAMSSGFQFDFQNAGVMADGQVWTRRVEPKTEAFQTIRSILEKQVDESFYVPEQQLPRWEWMKGPKNEERVAKNGHRYRYTEGRIPYPDSIDLPSRTILTGEGGTAPSRSNHLIKDPETDRLRVLTPLECERLNGFRDNWTLGMPLRWRYFTMGNALVVGLVTRMGHQLNKWLESSAPRPAAASARKPASRTAAAKKKVPTKQRRL